MIQCPDHPQAYLIYNESGDQICSECSRVIAEKLELDTSFYCLQM